MLKSNYEFEVLVNGKSVKEYSHNGSMYIEAKEGSTFSLRMKNNSSSRSLFVPTVDGLSIMNGKEGSFKSSGYIINGYDSMTISGWRTSDDKVAEFFFSKPGESYAKKKGKGGNLGVIGCAVFIEEVPKTIIKTVIEKEYVPYYPVYPKPYDPWYPQRMPLIFGEQSVTNVSHGSNNINSMYSLSASSVNKSTSTGLGTGFGQDKYSPVVKVDFDRESSPKATFTIFYNTRKNLESMGIEFVRPLHVAPSAFPKEDSEYCERP